MKRNDLSPSLAVTLFDVDTAGNRTVVDLTHATVVFNMKQRGETTRKVDGEACVVTDATAGEVAYEWQTGDTDTSGVFDGEFEVTFSSGANQTYPREGFVPIRIGNDL